MRRRFFNAKGIGLSLLTLVAMIYALYGFGSVENLSLGWTILFFGIIFACCLAVPSLLQLLARDVAELRTADPEEGQYQSLKNSTVVPERTERNEKHVEKQLLEAIERLGKITPARAALETPLTVAEADRLLSELANRGYLEIQIDEGKLVYTL